MCVITISRDLGSEGEYIAKKAARELGYHFVGKDFFSKILSQYGLVEFDREYDVLPGFWEKLDAVRSRNRDEEVTMLNKVIRAVAHHGNAVILGRSGFEVLREFASILHVRLQSPIDVRVERVMAEMDYPLELAKSVVKENDEVHKAFVNEYYELPWDTIHTFDMVINTGKIPPDMATDWIVDVAKHLELSSEPNSLKSLEEDPILFKAVVECLTAN